MMAANRMSVLQRLQGRGPGSRPAIFSQGIGGQLSRPAGERRSIALCQLDSEGDRMASSTSSFSQVPPTTSEDDELNQIEDDTAGLLQSPLQGQPRDTQSPWWKPPAWAWIMAMCTASVVISYADRTNVSTAIIPMAKEFDWSKEEQGFILSVFFVGYAITQVIGGSLSDKAGGKGVLAGGITIWSLCTFLTPEAARAGWPVLIANRIVLGLGEGVAFPAIHSIISNNVPFSFQSSAASIATSASYAGTVLAFFVSPLIIGAWDWPWVFYLFGGLALFWIPFWLPMAVSSQTPQSRKAFPKDANGDDTEGTMSWNGPDEDRGSGGIITEIRPLASPQGARASWISEARELLPLMATKPVLAICIAQYTQSWGMYTLINWLPRYFHDVFEIEVKDVGMYTLGPYIVQFLVGMVAGPMADRLLARGWHVVTVRRVFQSVGMLGPAVCLLLATQPSVASSVDFVTTVITLGLGLSAFSLAGVSVSHLDVAPKHAGAIFGIGNTAATVAGFVGVWAVGGILEQTHSWSLVFAVATAHYAVGVAFWNVWVRGEPLPQDRT
ncbi:unnamed protein product [Ostreobium quekettii]|uniref:Major facilitator superfamily (MFS) profile domain-containing protein n=1 Tax=Ostreobium quekettii TaxID=121088 RepID=A0A8S1IV68_9CHLO|nr:unnamed protein product [Ostreobium quekettii]|eukprot:evm.model.scf_2403.1 EVM.evm.TU.scf_2403.1   scf_2403:9115-11448(+)